MCRTLWKSLLVSPAVLGTTLVVVSAALADETPQVNPVTKAQTDSTSTRVAAQKSEPAVRDIKAQAPAAVKLLRGKHDPSKPEVSAANQVASTLPSKPQSAHTNVAATPAPVPSGNLSAPDFSKEEEINSESSEPGADEQMEQVTNVSQLRDVRPGDWAYEALRELVERYGCIAGYPDSTYRGNRAMTRYEFAAGLRACLNQIEKLIAASTTNFSSKQDLATLQRLTDEFGTELAKLRGRVDGLEARTAELEANQFSTTTKLNAEAIFAVAGVANGDNASRQRIPRQTVVGDRVRLNFDTSFTGKDLLRTRIQALNLDAFSSNSTLVPEGDLRFAGGTFAKGNNNTAVIDALLYQFPIGKSTTVVVEVNNGQPDDYTNTVNPYFDNDGASGALSNFGTRNPIYDLINGGGLGLRQQLGNKLELSLGYIATSPTIASPERGNGLFNGPYGGIGQLTIKPNDKLTFGLTYIHSYNNDLTAGSQRANLRSYLAFLSNAVPPTGSSAGSTQPAAGLAAFGGNPNNDLPVSSNAYGVEASFQLSPRFVLNGWVGYTATRILKSISTGDVTLNRGDLSILNYAVNLAFPDLGKKGNLAGIIFGMEPKVTGVSRSIRESVGKDRDTSFHVEGFYQYAVTENIAITPGLIWLTAPNHDSRNASDLIGVIRTTFTF